MKKVLSFLTLGLTCNLPKLSSRIEGSGAANGCAASLFKLFLKLIFYINL